MLTLKNNFKIALLLPLLLFGFGGVFGYDITINSISPTTIPAYTYCWGSSITVNFTATSVNHFTGQNTFAVQISNDGVNWYTLNSAQFTITHDNINNASDGTFDEVFNIDTVVTNYQIRVCIPSLTPDLGNPVVFGSPITVTANPNISSITDPSGNLTICSTDSDVLRVTVSGGTGALSCIWQYNGAPVANGTPGNAHYTVSTTTDSLIVGHITAASFPTTATYRCIVTDAAGCSALSLPATLNVDSLQISFQTGNLSICSSDSAIFHVTTAGATNLSYQWQSSPNGSTGWANVSTGPNLYSYHPDSLTVKGLIGAGTSYYRCQISAFGGSCYLYSATDTLNISAPPTGINSPLPSSSICTLGLDTLRASATGATSYHWQYSADNSTWVNITGNGTPNNATYSNAATNALAIAGITSSITYYYRCMISSGTGTTCSVPTNSSTLIVVSAPSVNSPTPSSLTICPTGTDTLRVSASGGTPSLAIQWQYSSTGISGWAPVNNQPTGFTYNNQTTSSLVAISGINSSGTSYYRCVVAATGSGCTTQASSNASIYVALPISINTQPTSPLAICAGGSATFLNLSAAGGTPSPIYQWQDSITGGWSNYAGGNTTLTTSAMNTPGNYPFRCIISASGSGCKSDTSISAYLNVAGQATAATPSITNGSICTLGATTLTETPSSSGTGTINYQWQYYTGTLWTDITGNNTPSGANYNNEQTDSLMSISSINSLGTYLYRCNIKPSGNGCNLVSSLPVTLNVVGQPNVTLHADTPTAICTGGKKTFRATATGGTPLLTYHWQNSPNPTGPWNDLTLPIGATYVGQGTDSLVVSTISTAGLYYYRCYVSAAGNACSTDTSGVITDTIILQPNPITPTATNLTICTGGNTILKEPSGIFGTGPVTYLWKLNGGALSNATYTGQGTDSLTVTNLTALNNQLFTCQILSAANGCTPHQSSAVTVSVISDPVISTPAFSHSTICTGGGNSASVALTSPGNGTSHYQWQYQSGSGWVNVVPNLNLPSGTSYSGDTTNQLQVISDPDTGTFNYRCIITQSTSGCADTSAASHFSVVTGPGIKVITPFAAICTGGTSTCVTKVDSAISANTFQWQYDSLGHWINVHTNTPIGANYGGPTDSILTISGNIDSGSYQYQCILNPGGTSCNASTNAVLVVKPKPHVTLQPVDPAGICTGGVASVTLLAGGGTPYLSYQWYYHDPISGNKVVIDAGGNGLPQGTNYVGDTSNLLEVKHTSLQGNYQYFCLVSASGSGCQSTTSDTIIVHVVPQPQIGTPAVNDTFCSGGNTKFKLSVINGISPFTYQWEYSDGGNWAILNSLPTGVANYADTATDSVVITTNNSILPGSYWYRCIIASAPLSGCNSVTSDSAAMTITADPYFTTQPVVGSNANSDTICVGGADTIAVVGAGGFPLPLTYKWEYLSPGGSSWSTVGNNSSILNINGSSAGINSYRVHVLAAASGCKDSLSQTVVIHVAQNPTINSISPTASICAGADTVITVSATGGTPSLMYQWQYNNGGTWSNVSTGIPGGVNYSDSTTATLHFNSNNTVAAQNYNYRCIVSAHGSGCQNRSDSSYVKIYQLPPTPNFTSEFSTICAGATGVSMLITDTAVANNYTFLWNSNPSGLRITGVNSAYPTFDFPNSGSYTLSVTDYNVAGCSNTFTLPITVGTSSAPNAPINMVQVGDTQFLVVYNNNVSSYQWGYDNKVTQRDTVINGATFQSFTDSATGHIDTSGKRYWVIICDGNCCNKIYYNRGNTGVTTVTGVDEVTELRVFPNPANNFLNIETNGNFNIDAINMYDITGKLAQFHRQLNTHSTIIELANLQSGIYICEVVFENSIKARVKITITR